MVDTRTALPPVVKAAIKDFCAHRITAAFLAEIVYGKAGPESLAIWRVVR